MAIYTKNKKESGVIHYTYDYQMFKIDPKSNRKVNQNKVNTMIDVMKKHNKIGTYPIIVDSDYVIKDGQHRYCALKVINEKEPTKIAYVIDNEYEADMVAIYNSLQNTWKLEDYLDLFVNRGHKDYLDLKKLLETYNLPISTMISLFSKWDDYKSNVILFKRGKFRMPNSEDNEYNIAIQTANHCYDLKKYFKNFKDRSFMMAIKKLMRTGKYNPDRFIAKLDIYEVVGQPSPLYKDNTEGYLKQIEKIYNYKAGQRSRVKFTKED